METDEQIRPPIPSKTCKTCLQVLPITLFALCKASKDRLSYSCKPCISQYNKNRRKDPKVIEAQKVARKARKERDPIKYKEMERACWKKDKENNTKRKRKWMLIPGNREIAREQSKKARKPDYYKKAFAHKKARLARDPSYRALQSMRQRLWQLLKDFGGKNDRTMNLIGCSKEFLFKHIESQFLPEMSWDNYGRNGWHIDHIIPCSSFDLSDLEQKKKCFHWSNLQPLWGTENSLKSSKMPSQEIQDRVNKIYQESSL